MLMMCIVATPEAHKAVAPSGSATLLPVPVQQKPEIEAPVRNTQSSW